MFSDRTWQVKPLYIAAIVGGVVVLSLIFGAIYRICRNRAQQNERVAAEDSPAENGDEIRDDDGAPLMGKRITPILPTKWILTVRNEVTAT